MVTYRGKANEKDFTCFSFFVTGCQTNKAPVLEYTIAFTAIRAAQKAGATRLAPGYWNKAQQFYQKGQGHYKKREYHLSSEAFRQASLHAEKAEEVARIKKMQSGDPPF